VLGLATLVGIALNFLRIDPIQALFYTAVINGLVAPPLLVLIVLLGSDRSYMKSRVSGRLSKTLTWLAAGLMSVAAVALVATTLVIR
jgi:Mn2+/Fe2+ NRAMP family transporter